MSEENKQKVTLIKQVKPVEVPNTQSLHPQAQNASATSSQEKKKVVVVVKKKPVVVVKTQPQVVEKAEPVKNEPVVENTPVKEEKATAKPIEKPSNPVQQTQTNKEPARQQASQVSAVKPQVKQTIIGLRPAPQPVKPQPKKPSVNNPIANGPVIISGANLPPLNAAPKAVSKPVGSVGGVTYGHDGKRIVKPSRPSGSNQQHRNNGQPNSGLYTPKSNQGKTQGGFNKDRQGGFGNNRPSFGQKPANKGGFAPAQDFGEGKTKRVFSKDKGRDRRHETTEDEFELKTLNKKKSSEPAAVVSKSIDIMSSITVSDLAKKMNIKATEIITKLFSMGMMVTMNQSIDSDTAILVASEYGCEVHLIDLYQETIIASDEDHAEDLVPRAPIVTVMGHVDHGKTKLLDAIRSTNVIDGEFGGITQHIGAYKVNIPEKGDVVFLDTPGHAAFTMMRARGAQITDIVVLVVAANDGVMPQTLEAIDHAKAAKVPIIVAINKIDLPEAKPERVMQQLSDKGLIPEEWGGDTIYCQISAKKKIGIENLLESILIQAEVMELKANPKCRAEGKVLEARIDQGRGTIATMIVQKGTLKQGDYFCAGIYSGRVRSLTDDKGRKITSAGPSTPVEVTGLSEVPSAGDPFQVCTDEKQARQISTKRQELARLDAANKFKKVTLENMFEVMHEGDAQELNIVIKGDVQGSVEALQGALEKLSTPEIRVRVIRAAAGAIIEDDINLASASENPALVIGFNVRPTPRAQARADEAKVEIRKYNIIYNVVDDVKAAMEGMLSPEKKEIDVGTATILKVFKVPKVGFIAGCRILSGSVKRSNYCRVIRDYTQLSDNLLKIFSLKHEKDDVKEVTEGFECGIGIEGFQDFREGDTIEFVEIQETARKLETSGEYI